MAAEIDKSLTDKFLKTDCVIEILVLVELDLLQDYITMSVRL
jgi:hypothetical protein